MPNTINLSPYTAETDAIARQRKLAELLQAQSLEPTETKSIGGWAIPTSPWEHIGKLAKAGAGAYGQYVADQRTKALADRMKGDTDSAISRFQHKMAGTPEQWFSEGIDERMQPGQAPDMRGAYFELLQSPDPMLKQAALARLLKGDEGIQIGSGGLMKPDGTIIPPAARPVAPTPHSIGAGGLRLPDGTIVPPVAKPEKPEGKWSDPYQMGGAWVQKNDLTGQVRQAVNREPMTTIHSPPPITAVTIQDPKDPNKTIVVDGRSGRVIGPGPKASDVGKLENKRQFNMQGIGATIQKAEDILSGKNGELPTGSVIGAGVDYLGSIVGASPKGAAEADQMKAIGGALTAKMPRMEGPQSDKDVALYKEMAARVGDNMLPIDRRKAALETVKELWAKYERLNPDAFADRRGGSDEPPPGAVRRK